MCIDDDRTINTAPSASSTSSISNGVLSMIGNNVNTATTTNAATNMNTINNNNMNTMNNSAFANSLPSPQKVTKMTYSKRKPCLATVYCLDCEQAMCDKAARIHSRTRISREHTVIPIDDVEFRKTKPKSMCPFHHCPIEYLCLEDDCLLCIKCLPSPLHNGHRCKPILEALQEETKLISDDLIQQGRNKIDSVSIALKTTEETIDGVEVSRKRVRNEIEDYITTISTIVKDQKKLLLEQVEDITESKLKILCAQAESLRTILESLVNGCEHLESEDSNEARDLIMKRLFRKSVNNNKLSLTPESQNDLGFIPREKILSILTTLGEVSESGLAAFQSCAEGGGINSYYALAPNGVSFTITTKTRSGDLVRNGGAKISIQIADQYQPQINIVDKEDGTYQVSYLLQEIEKLSQERSFQMRVFVNKKDIAGSPFQVMIRRDYNYILHRNLMGIGLVSGGVIDNEFMYVALYSQQQVVKVRIATGVQEQRIAVDGQPYAMVVEEDLLFVCLYNTHWVGAYNKNTGELVRRMGGPGQLINPVGMAMEGNTLYVTEHFGHRVHALDKNTGNTIEERCINDNTLASPFAIHLDDNFIYVSSNTGNHIKVYHKEHLTLERTVGNEIGTFLQSPISLAMDDDILFVGCNGNNIVQLYRKGTFEPLGTIHNVMQPYSATTHEKLLYVCCMGNSQVSIYKPSYLDGEIGEGTNALEAVDMNAYGNRNNNNNQNIPDFDVIEMEQDDNGY